MPKVLGKTLKRRKVNRCKTKRAFGFNKKRRTLRKKQKGG